MPKNDSGASSNFVTEIIDADNEAGRFGGRVHTRFPPEPNGYLHIGHAKAFCLNFGLAARYGGLCNLRYDDTNPEKEEVEYVTAIQEDVRWLGWDWGDRLFHASDYFDKLCEFAFRLIRAGKAYVCDLSADQIRETRGTLTRPGTESPYRNRSVDENLNLFERMRAGEFPEGSRVLRAKIDMSSPNLNMRDPIMYRILKATHHRTGDKWCIYPTYDFAHGQSDSIEGITHSICSLEFEDHRPLYDWYLDNLGIHHPRQIEFARLNLTYTVMSKRRLRELVEEGHVRGWDDPRMPTLSGMRRRGYTPEAIRTFLDTIGVAKRDSVVDIALLEHCIREDLNKRSPRRMAVLRPLRMVIENYPEDRVEELDALNNPEDPSSGTRKVPFSRVVYVEKDDFREVPPPKFHRLSPGREVRLRYSYCVKCVGLVKDEKTGEVVELRCTHDPDTKGERTPDGRKVKGTIHWVSAKHAVDAEVRLYDHLFSRPDPGGVEEGPEEGTGEDSYGGLDVAGAGRASSAAEAAPRDWKADVNPSSLETLTGCKLEPALAGVAPGFRCQFERLGYFCADPDCAAGRPVFNRTVTLRDTWAKIEKARQP